MDKLQKLESLLEPCRYVTKLLGGEKYVSCSMVLPAICHILRVMESSDDDPAYMVKFKFTFTTDMEKRKEKANTSYDCHCTRPKSQGPEVFTQSRER
ncbi:unnamed protein product [Merluccius merluccius]